MQMTMELIAIGLYEWEKPGCLLHGNWRPYLECFSSGFPLRYSSIKADSGRKAVRVARSANILNDRLTRQRLGSLCMGCTALIWLSCR